MGEIVKCPHCKEVNTGSQRHCVKCHTSLVGLPREQDTSPNPEFVSPNQYVDYYGKPFPPLVFKDETASRQMTKKTKRIIGGVLATIYILSAPFALLKMISLQSEGSMGLILSAIFFVIGLAIYLTPAETLLRFDRQTGYFLYKMTPNEEAGLGCASAFYTLFGLVTMLFTIGLNLAALFASR